MNGNCLYFVFLILTVLCPDALAEARQNASPPPLISMLETGFIRDYTTNEKQQLVEGMLYYTETRTVAKVHKPLNQVMILSNATSTMTLYYPDTKEGFLFRGKRPFSLPFLQFFIWSLNPDQTLEKAEFSLSKTALHNDTLISYWLPNKSLKKFLSHLNTKSHQGSICAIEVIERDSTSGSLVTIQEHTDFEKIKIPKILQIAQFKGRDTTWEKIIFSPQSVNKPLPEEILLFKVPLDAKLKEIKW